MGLYDTVRVGEFVNLEGKQEIREGQVKCWGENMRLITIGDSVPSIDGWSTYQVAMREGGYLMVFKNTLIAWEDELSEEFQKVPVFDKWGSPLNHPEDLEKEIHGLLGNERYTF